MSDIKKIGFVGIGRMGYPMAGHLVKAGFTVMVIDTNQEVVQKFVKEYGVRTVDTLVELAQSVDVIITMLPTSKIVSTVILGDSENSDCLIKGLDSGKIVIDSSTSDPVVTRQLGSKLSDNGVSMLDAPVAGGEVFAIDGSLDITVGGDTELLERCRPLFDAIGGSIIHCGELGSGHAIKALNNFVNASALITAVEALTIGCKFGLDLKTMIESMTAAATGRNNPIQKKVIPHILSRRFATGMDLSLIAKDTRITVDIANALDAYAPVAERCSALWAEASENIGAFEDQTCVAKLWEQKNKVKLELKE